MTEHRKHHQELTLDEALAKWDAGEGVWTIEMGGIGPGYEQCIQVGIFELAKRIKDETLPEPGDDHKLSDALDKHLFALMKECPPLDGLSGAQAGAIKSIAYNFATKGYTETLNMVEPDRRIQCSRTFPAMVAA